MVSAETAATVPSRPGATCLSKPANAGPGVARAKGYRNVTRRQAENPQLAAVLLIDLDNFKSINDRFGHAVGDKVLQVFAETAAATVRPSDFVGGLGGEEFAAVLYNVGRERGLVIAERIRSAFAEATSVVNGKPVAGTLSIGMVYRDERQFDVPPLLAQADQAL